ncbi:hypothetical protein ACFVX6_15895 [Streptomyces sp. NPDC058289]|uniref:hypothetical protein n=1 Tax=Streptomyces sp. NPDC058289 TaxID=3346425 RepID=UPI0036E90250
MLVLGTVVAGTSFGVTQAILQDHHGMSLGDPGALRAVAASALLAPLCALTGMALGALIRHAAGTVVAVVGILLMLPPLFWGETYRWVKEIGNAMPLTAWRPWFRTPRGTTAWTSTRYRSPRRGLCSGPGRSSRRPASVTTTLSYGLRQDPSVSLQPDAT